MTKRQRAEADELYKIKPLPKKWQTLHRHSVVMRTPLIDLWVFQNSLGVWNFEADQARISLHTTMEQAKAAAERWHRRQLTKALTKVKASKVTGNGEGGR